MTGQTPSLELDKEATQLVVEIFRESLDRGVQRRLALHPVKIQMAEGTRGHHDIRPMEFGIAGMASYH